MPIQYPIITLPMGLTAAQVNDPVGYYRFTSLNALPPGYTRATPGEVQAWINSLPSLSTFEANESGIQIVVNSAGQTLAGYVGEVVSNTPISQFVQKYFTVQAPTGTTPPGPTQDPGVTLYQQLTNALLGVGITVPQGTTLSDLEAIYKKAVEDQLLGQGAGVLLSGNDTVNTILLNVQNFVKQFTQPFVNISNTLSGVSAGVTDFVNSIQAGGRNIGSVITWLDQPHTLERFGAIGLGFVLFLVGLVAFIFSFVDVGEVAKTAAVAAG